MRYYGIFSILIVILLIRPQIVLGQIIGWDMNGLSGNEESVDATTISDFLQVSTLIRGSGLNGSSLSDAFNSSSFSADSTFETAKENDDYIEFTIQAIPGATVSLSTLDTRFRRSSTGPFKFLWQYSLDSFDTPGIAIGDTITYEQHSGEGHNQDLIDLSGISELQNVDSETIITIRLYGWGATAGTGTFAIGRRSGNDLEIDGTVGMPPGPIIDHTPIGNTESTDDQTAIATITGESLITEEEDDNRPVLLYRVNGGNWFNTYYDNQSGDGFSFIIPGQSNGSTVEYYIAAKDEDGVTTHPFGGSGENPPGSSPPETFHSYTILEPPPEIDGFEFYFTTDPNDVSEENRISYPTAGMGKEEGDIKYYADDDWTYIDPEFTFYLVVLGNDELMAAEFYLNWDDTFVDVDDDDIEIGTIFPNSEDNEFVEKVGDGRMHINAVSFEGNVSPQIGDYLAKIPMTVLKPGKYEIFVDDIDLRYYNENEDNLVEVPAESFPGEIKFFLGDFGSNDNDGERGDGVIDFTDLMLFASAYWSERSDGEYRTKYDIGPTDEGGYFSMPAPDGVIDFEDLIIFAIGYFRSAGGLLHKQVYEPLRIVAYEPQVRGNSVVLPLGFEGNVNDVRALSLKLGIPESTLTFTGATAAGELDQDMGFIASREADGIVQLDASIIRSSFSQEGIFAHLYFEINEPFDPSSVGFISAIARNSHNEDIPVEASHYIEEHHRRIPAAFKLLQNYPNPFNPVTTIEYQIPEDAYVNIAVYNILGETVAVLLNEHQESGYYSVEWDGTMFNNQPAPSGLYMYRMKAGNYFETKRMILLK